VYFVRGGSYVNRCGGLLAAGLDGGSALQVGGNVVRSECFCVHLDQRNKGAPEIGELPTAAIYDGSCRNDDAAMIAHDLDCFLHTTASGHDILRYHETLACLDLKATAQHKSPIAILLNEDVAFTEMAGDFLTNNDPTDCRRNDSVCVVGAELVCEHSADARRYRCVLKQKGTLEKFPAVKPAAKNEVAVEQSPSLFEEIKNAWHSKWAVN